MFGFANKDNLLQINLPISLFKHIMQASFVSDSLANLTVLTMQRQAQSRITKKHTPTCNFVETLKGHIMCRITPTASQEQSYHAVELTCCYTRRAEEMLRSSKGAVTGEEGGRL